MPVRGWRFEGGIWSYSTQEIREPKDGNLAFVNISPCPRALESCSGFSAVRNMVCLCAREKENGSLNN